MKNLFLASAMSLVLVAAFSFAADPVEVTEHNDAAKEHEIVVQHHKNAAKLHKEGKHEEAKKEASAASSASASAHEKSMIAEDSSSQH